MPKQKLSENSTFSLAEIMKYFQRACVFLELQGIKSVDDLEKRIQLFEKHKGPPYKGPYLADRFTMRCPHCGKGKNCKGAGGNERCFHCDSCGWVECVWCSPEQPDWEKYDAKTHTKSA